MSSKRKANGYYSLKKMLKDNLESRGLIEYIYIDKVQEYMDLWQLRNDLKKDIAERGVVVLDQKRGMLVENRSVSLSVQISRQMLAIYQALGFKESAVTESGETYEDDEL